MGLVLATAGTRRTVLAGLRRWARWRSGSVAVSWTGDVGGRKAKQVLEMASLTSDPAGLVATSRLTIPPPAEVVWPSGRKRTCALRATSSTSASSREAPSPVAASAAARSRSQHPAQRDPARRLHDPVATHPGEVSGLGSEVTGCGPIALHREDRGEQPVPDPGPANCRDPQHVPARRWQPVDPPAEQVAQRLGDGVGVRGPGQLLGEQRVAQRAAVDVVDDRRGRRPGEERGEQLGRLGPAEPPQLAELGRLPHVSRAAAG